MFFEWQARHWLSLVRFAAEVVDAQTEQPDRAPPGFGLVQEMHGSCGQLKLLAGCGCRMTSGDGRKVSIADFECHRPSDNLGADQPPGCVGSHLSDLRSNRFE